MCLVWSQHRIIVHFRTVAELGWAAAWVSTHSLPLLPHIQRMRKTQGKCLWGLSVMDEVISPK